MYNEYLLGIAAGVVAGCLVSIGLMAWRIRSLNNIIAVVFQSNMELTEMVMEMQEDTPVRDERGRFTKRAH